MTPEETARRIAERAWENGDFAFASAYDREQGLKQIAAEILPLVRALDTLLRAYLEAKWASAAMMKESLSDGKVARVSRNLEAAYQSASAALKGDE